MEGTMPTKAYYEAKVGAYCLLSRDEEGEYFYFPLRARKDDESFVKEIKFYIKDFNSVAEALNHARQRKEYFRLPKNKKEAYELVLREEKKKRFNRSWNRRKLSERGLHHIPKSKGFNAVALDASEKRIETMGREPGDKPRRFFNYSKWSDWEDNLEKKKQLSIMERTKDVAKVWLDLIESEKPLHVVEYERSVYTHKKYGEDPYNSPRYKRILGAEDAQTIHLPDKFGFQVKLKVSKEEIEYLPTKESCRFFPYDVWEDWHKEDQRDLLVNRSKKIANKWVEIIQTAENINEVEAELSSFCMTSYGEYPFWEV